MIFKPVNVVVKSVYFYLSGYLLLKILAGRS